MTPVVGLFVIQSIHVNDPDLAFKDGLFSGDYETKSFAANGYYVYDDFYALGLKVGLSEAFVKRELKLFPEKKDHVAQLIGRSFMEAGIKKTYSDLYLDKCKRLAYSMNPSDVE